MKFLIDFSPILTTLLWIFFNPLTNLLSPMVTIPLFFTLLGLDVLAVLDYISKVNSLVYKRRFFAPNLTPWEMFQAVSKAEKKQLTPFELFEMVELKGELLTIEDIK